MRPEDVDDPLERVVEAVEQRRCPAGGRRRGAARGRSRSRPRARAAAASRSCRVHRLAGLHLGPVVVPRRGWSGRAWHERRSSAGLVGFADEPPARADRRRRRRAGAAGRPAPRPSPSIGNASASVASSMPRCSRFSARLSSGPTNASPSSPAPTPSPASTDRASSTAAVSSTSLPERLTTSTSITGSAVSRSARRAPCTPRRSAARACGGRRPGG